MSYEDWEKFKKAYAIVEEQYKKEQEETPWYHNTHNCWLNGSIDELKDIDINKIDWDGITCYLAGRKEVLEKLHDEFMKEIYNSPNNITVNYGD